MDRLKLEFPTRAHEKDAIQYVKETREYGEAHGCGGLENYLDNYAAWLEKLDEDLHRKPSEKRVPAETYFLVRESDNKIVGMINIRLGLNQALWNHGGHIGYSIRPTERRKGYNKINLYLALRICQKRGIKTVLLDCNKENLGSARTMQALGGKLICEYFDGEEDVVVQKYIIDVDGALAENQARFAEMVVEK